jgi:hypothetical protein
MSVLHTDEVAPQLFECFIDRAEADLPELFPKEAKGAVVAGPDVIRGLEDYSDSYESWGSPTKRPPSWRSNSGVSFGTFGVIQIQVDPKCLSSRSRMFQFAPERLERRYG